MKTQYQTQCLTRQLKNVLGKWRPLIRRSCHLNTTAATAQLNNHLNSAAEVKPRAIELFQLLLFQSTDNTGSCLGQTSMLDHHWLSSGVLRLRRACYWLDLADCCCRMRSTCFTSQLSPPSPLLCWYSCTWEL